MSSQKITRRFFKISCVLFLSSLLTGCFELTDPSQQSLMTPGSPFKDLAILRLVNITDGESKEIAESRKCPNLMRLDKDNTYQIYNCQGKKVVETKFYFSPDYPDLWLHSYCFKEEASSDCVYLTVKIKGDLAFWYLPDSSVKAEFFAFLKDKVKDPGGEQQLTQLELKNRTQDTKSTGKGPDPFLVGTVDEMFFLANLIVHNPIKTTKVHTYAIE